MSTIGTTVKRKRKHILISIRNHVILGIFLAAVVVWSGSAEAYEYDRSGVRIAGTINADDYQRQFDLEALRVQQEEQHQQIQLEMQRQRNIIRQLELQNNRERY